MDFAGVDWIYCIKHIHTSVLDITYVYNTCSVGHYIYIHTSALDIAYIYIYTYIHPVLDMTDI